MVRNAMNRIAVFLPLLLRSYVAGQDVAVSALDPTVRSERPAAASSAPGGLTGLGEYRALLSKFDVRSKPLIAEAGGLIEGHNGAFRPIVADVSMCQPPSVDGGLGTYSPRALIHDLYYNLRVTAAGNLTFTAPMFRPGGSSPQGGNAGTLSIVALDRTLPAGFALTWPDGSCILTADAPTGATSLSLSSVHTAFSIASGQVADNGNFMFMQGGVARPTLRNLTLIGDPNPRLNIDISQETSRKYACDGVALECTGAEIDNLDVSNFPGHGVWLGYPKTLGKGTHFGDFSPWDRAINHIGYLRAERCLTGLTVAANDAKVDTCVANGCRDSGAHFLGGTATSCDKAHLYGCRKGFWGEGTVRFAYLETETCNYGTELAGYNNQIGHIRAYNNKYCDARIDCGTSRIDSIITDHSSSAVDSTDSLPTGYSVIIGSWCDGLSIGNLQINCTHDAGGANGLLVGHAATKTLGVRPDDGMVVGFELRGYIRGDSSEKTYGVHFLSPMKAGEVSLHVDGFAHDVHFDSAAVMTGCTVRFYGPAAATIHWSDGTIGTFRAPNIPSSVKSMNDVRVLAN